MNQQHQQYPLYLLILKILKYHLIVKIDLHLQRQLYL